MKNDRSLRLLFAVYLLSGWRRSCSFPDNQFRFHGVLVVKFGTWAVNTLQENLGRSASHFTQRLAHSG
jgi:hypothetical protein